MTTTVTKPSIEPSVNGYKMLLGISSNTLVVFDEEVTQIVETILNGNDSDALLVECSDENHFLDVINAVKCMIADGYNPKEWLLS